MAAALWPAVARGQSTVPSEPDPAAVRVRIGSLWIRPTLALTNVGVDTNVFNVADAAHPQSDFTITAAPQVELWLRAGRTWLSGGVREDLVWYRKFANQRSINSINSVGWLVPLTRMTFTAGTSWVNARDRPGFEIDTRVQRSEHDYNGAAELRALSKTLIGVRADRRTVNFDQAEVFLGSNLHDQLNRVQTTGAVTARHELTPLTSVTLDVSKQQDRFDFNPLRDSDSTQVTAGLKFTPDALISGSAQFGYRRFKPLAADVPGYKGGTVSVNLGYVLLGTTKMGVQVARDVQYSFDVDRPYFLLSALSGTIAQQLFGPVDVEGRMGRQRLAYRMRDGVTTGLLDLVDHTRTYGGGVGYHLGVDLRLAFNVEHQSRVSGVDGRSYGALRYGTAATYVF
jgi:hypothetical protein